MLFTCPQDSSESHRLEEDTHGIASTAFVPNKKFLLQSKRHWSDPEGSRDPLPAPNETTCSKWFARKNSLALPQAIPPMKRPGFRKRTDWPYLFTLARLSLLPESPAPQPERLKLHYPEAFAIRIIAASQNLPISDDPRWIIQEL